MFTYYIPPKCAKTREPKDEHCVSQCTYIRDNIHDPIPLDKRKNHTALPYITVIYCAQYSKNPKNFHVMSVKSTNKNKINIGRKQRERETGPHQK